MEGGKQVAVVMPALLLLAAALAGCGGVTSLPEVGGCPSSNESGTPADPTTIDVYFGCGCFWHVQHEFVKLEMSDLCREGEQITTRAAYAGGNAVGDGGQVCYHNYQGAADYGKLGHFEVVAMTLPAEHFAAAAERFWDVCVGGNRQDPQDRGGEYRSGVGLPGGMSSPLVQQLQVKAGNVKLVNGAGDEGDTLHSGKVFVYDTATHPSHLAEKYHQFHDDMMARYSDAYHALRKYAVATTCPGDGGKFVV